MFEVWLTVLALMPVALTIGNVENDNNFDFLVFAQIWPITSCDIWESESESNECNLPKESRDRWTIHGIWPSTAQGHGPFECNKTAEFDPKLLDPILEKLQAQWTDVHENGPKDDFWKHEWIKHGTCAMQLEPLNTELKYFSKGLDLNNRYNIESILSKAGIEPGEAYTGDEIMIRLTEALSKKPGLGCVKNEKRFGDDPEGKLLLAQVEICLDKNLNLIDCKDKLFGGCSPTKAVNYYPRETHRSIQSDRANKLVLGLAFVICSMIVIAICIYVGYRKKIMRYREYENI